MFVLQRGEITIVFPAIWFIPNMSVISGHPRVYTDEESS